MKAIELLKEEIINARETFEGTVADLNEEKLHKNTEGKALPLGSVYAHLILSEDMIVSTMLQKKSALSDTTFKDKTGVDLPLAPMDENWSSENEKWARSVHIDIESFRKYSKAVYDETDKYLESLNDEDLGSEVDLGSWGKKTIAYILYAMVLGHTYSLTGEISALKGLQGLKGYPF
jgi:hypothetical protein